MPGLKFEIVTAERIVYSDDVDVVIAPGIDGQLAILPNHTPLLTMIQPGDLTVRREGEEEDIFVSGGFLEVIENRVTVLADTAERAEEIDLARAEASRKRAEERLRLRPEQIDIARAEVALKRAMMRIRVAERRRRRPPTGRPGS